MAFGSHVLVSLLFPPPSRKVPGIYPSSPNACTLAGLLPARFRRGMFELIIFRPMKPSILPSSHLFSRPSGRQTTPSPGSSLTTRQCLFQSSISPFFLSSPSLEALSLSVYGYEVSLLPRQWNSSIGSLEGPQLCLGPKWRAPTKLLASHSNPNIATQKSLSNISVLNKVIRVNRIVSHSPKGATRNRTKLLTLIIPGDNGESLEREPPHLLFASPTAARPDVGTPPSRRHLSNSPPNPYKLGKLRKLA